MTARARNLIAKATPTPRLSDNTVAAGFVAALAELAVQRGAKRAELLRQASLTEDEIADPDLRVPFAKYVTLMRAGQALSGDPALALHFGEAYDISELSIVGLVGQGCATVGEALAELNRLARLTVEVDGPLADRLVVRRESDGVWLVDTRENPNEFLEITESSFARMVCSARRLGAPNLIEAVHLTHSAPSYRAEYERIFRVPITFESHRNALLMGQDDSWLRQPLALQPRYVFGVLSERAEALLKKLETAKTVRGRVENALMPVLHLGNSRMERIAATLGLSRRTLARRLKDEGTTFEAVLDGLRHKLAVSYLKGKKVSVNETAYLVGFSEPAAFSRAYKRWTGESPKAARRLKKA